MPSSYRDTARLSHEGLEGFDGIFAFVDLSTQCLECGGPRFFNHYQALIDALPFASAKRRAYEDAIYGGMQTLNFDSGGRITLSDSLCEAFGFKDTVQLVGLRDRFQIWEPEAYATYSKAQANLAKALFAQEGEGA